MPKYVIERSVPDAGQMGGAAHSAWAGTPSAVVRDLGPEIQWVHSSASDEEIIRVDLVTNPEIVREHGRRGDFAVDAALEVPALLAAAIAEVQS